jgi:hypothetical protein
MSFFEIYFCGFICHIGPREDEDSTRTIVVKSLLIADGDNHIPRILSAYDEGVGMATPNNSRRKIVRHKLGVKLNTGVGFTGLGAEAVASGLFLDTVPHLDDLTSSGIKLHSNPPGLFVQIPAGTFTVVEFYEEGAIWRVDGNIYVRPCVPRVTMLTARSARGASVHFNGQDMPLANDGWVLITNLEREYEEPSDPTAAPDLPGVHWKKHHSVTTGSPDDLATYEKLPRGSFAKLCKKTPFLGVHTEKVLDLLKPHRLVDSSECTNSHWP